MKNQHMNQVNAVWSAIDKHVSDEYPKKLSPA